MGRCKGAILILYVCVLLPTVGQGQPQHESNLTTKKGVGTPTITITKTDLTDRTLRVSYEIHNSSGHDIWICEDISLTVRGYHFEAYMAEDRQTLLIRRRLDIEPSGSAPPPPRGRYVRLREGKVRTESLVLSLPVASRFFWGFPTSEGKAYAKSLALEIGYYLGDMPGMIRRILTKPKEPPSPPVTHGIDPATDGPILYYPTPNVSDRLGNLLYFNWYNWPNGHVGHRDEELVIPSTGGTNMGEQVVRARIDGLAIPYKEKYDRPEISPPDLSCCTRLEIRYRPSLLDYFFPYPSERVVMSDQEVEHLRSLHAVVVDDQECISAFGREIAEEGLIGGIVAERSTAEVVCYRDRERFTSFTVYDDRAIVTLDEQCIRYSMGLPSLRVLTLPIRPFQLRLECANNLKNLGSILRFVYGSERAYPAAKWCDAILRDRRARDIPTEYKMKYLKCPGAGEGKCAYAINQACRPSSPSNTVLLFETEPGWNQHGGPELFTFHNHDPKGGLVLLNDGTVKFIRTEEELKQLRWK